MNHFATLWKSFHQDPTMLFLDEPTSGRDTCCLTMFEMDRNVSDRAFSAFQNVGNEPRRLGCCELLVHCPFIEEADPAGTYKCSLAPQISCRRLVRLENLAALLIHSQVMVVHQPLGKEMLEGVLPLAPVEKSRWIQMAKWEWMRFWCDMMQSIPSRHRFVSLFMKQRNNSYQSSKLRPRWSLFSLFDDVLLLGKAPDMWPFVTHLCHPNINMFPWYVVILEV